MTRLQDMTDVVLDATLTRLYTRHLDAEGGRRLILHRLIVDVLAEQKTRRDVVLGIVEPTAVGA